MENLHLDVAENSFDHYSALFEEQNAFKFIGLQQAKQSDANGTFTRQHVMVQFKYSFIWQSGLLFVHAKIQQWQVEKTITNYHTM